MPYCANCGTVVINEARFCSECGYLLNSRNQVASDDLDGIKDPPRGFEQRETDQDIFFEGKKHLTSRATKKTLRARPQKKAIILPIFFVLFILTLGAILFFLTGEDETYSISGFGPEATKADYYYIETLIDSYQESLVYAINNNDFPLLANLLFSDSDFYYAQKDLVEEHFKEGIKVELEDYDIKMIAKGEEGNYKVYLVETIRKDYPDKIVTTDESDWIILVVLDDESLLVRDKEEWVLEE